MTTSSQEMLLFTALPPLSAAKLSVPNVSLLLRSASFEEYLMIG